jgi:hypothetical protein
MRWGISNLYRCSDRRQLEQQYASSKYKLHDRGSNRSKHRYYNTELFTGYRLPCNKDYYDHPCPDSHHWPNGSVRRGNDNRNRRHGRWHMEQQCLRRSQRKLNNRSGNGQHRRHSHNKLYSRWLQCDNSCSSEPVTGSNRRPDSSM